MKFSHKLSIVVVALLGVLFTFGGAFLVYHEFENSLNNTIEHSTSQHYLEKYSLETDILMKKSNGYTVRNSYFQSYGERFTRYMNFSEQFMGFYTQEEVIYTTLPSFIEDVYIKLSIGTAGESVVVRKMQDKTFLLISSKINEIDETIYLVTAYDISSVYIQRQENLQFFWQLDLALLVVAAVASFVLSALLTRPLKNLNVASTIIAKGDYSKRVEVNTKDEIGELANSFNLMAGAIEEKMEMMQLSMQQKDDFVLAFTHEVKTPMTTIIGYASILRAKDCAPDVIERASSAIFSEAKRLEVLSQKLLALMGLSDVLLELSSNSLQELFKKCGQSLAHSAKVQALLKVSITEDIAVKAEPDLLVDLLRNLIINAVSATQEGGQVVVKARREEKFCIIEVQDTGCGIAKEDLQHICEPFYMVDKARRRREGATGIGLSLCKRIVELHGSTLTFTSELGVGTCVSFALEIWEEQEDTKKAEEYCE